MRTSRMYEVVRDRLERTHHLIAGKALSQRDEHHFCCSFAASISLLFRDYKGIANATWNDAMHLVRRLPVEVPDIEDLWVTMRNICYTDEDVQLPHPFNECRRVHAWLRMFTDKGKRTVTPSCGFFRQMWNTVFSFPLKCTLQDVDADADEQISVLTGPTQVNEYLGSALHEIISRYFRFDLNAFDPDYSSGATSEFRRRQGKGTKYLKAKPNNRYNIICQRYGWPKADVTATDRATAVLHAVPKKLTKKRFISMEPAIQTFLQQGARSILISAIESTSSPVGVKIDDQSINANEALYASYTRDYATIDLSAASDSVSWDLVKQVFPKDLVFILGAARSPYLQWQSDCYKMTAYAGMGNATTFSIETMLFASIVILACELADVRPSGSVYGDDIVAPTRCVPYLMDLLNALGFKPNVEKSHYLVDDPFREACGIEAYKGFDITPMRIPRKFQFNTCSDPESYASSVAFLNRLRELDNDLTRYLIKEEVNLSKKSFFSWSGRIGLKTYGSYTNENLRCRFNRRYQRYERRGLKVVSDETLIDDDIRYQMTLRALSKTTRGPIRAPEDVIEVRGGPVRLRLKWAWVAEDELS